VKLSPKGTVHPFVHPHPGVKTLYCLEEWKDEQRISHEGITPPPGDKINPWGTTSPLGSKFVPRGEVNNGPQIISHQGITSPPAQGDKINPWGTTLPLKSKFAPRGEVKNGPLEPYLRNRGCDGRVDRRREADGALVVRATEAEAVALAAQVGG
jgi:hypothetical protein